MSPPAALALEAVDVRYGSLVALRGADLRILPGESVALVGPSGAGKTTLLGLLNGTVSPATGRVLRGDVDLASLGGRALRRARSRIGLVPQGFGLVPELRVIQNVLSGRAGQRGTLGLARDLLLPSAEAVRNVHALLERMGIGDKLYERTARLSGGEQQRVAIARALYQEPEVLLADEPVASVDPVRSRLTLRLLLDLAAPSGPALVVSLHDIELARDLFPRLIGLREGRIRFDRPAAQVTAEDLARLYEVAA